ncbi:MAG: CDP-glycerol glycerophosphotransferase family protein, partial [Hungatella sp.]
MHKTNAEDRYIEKRKRKAFLTYVFCHMFWVLPVRKKKVVFTAFEGDGGHCCNPRYIAEELLKSNQNYEIVWLVN